MSAANDGGPVSLHFLHGLPVAGSLKLRDYFAGQALAGFLSKSEFTNESDEKFAAWCYSIADAMLAARTKENAQP